MDRLAWIVRWQWRAYWRRFSRGKNLAAGHQGITSIVTILILFKYLRVLRSASIDLASGNTTRVQSLLAVIFLAWLVLPFISRPAISRSSLRRSKKSPRTTYANYANRGWWSVTANGC